MNNLAVQEKASKPERYRVIAEILFNSGSREGFKQKYHWDPRAMLFYYSKTSVESLALACNQSKSIVCNNNIYIIGHRYLQNTMHTSIN